jgi:hypothetical protein
LPLFLPIGQPSGNQVGPSGAAVSLDNRLCAKELQNIGSVQIRPFAERQDSKSALLRLTQSRLPPPQRLHPIGDGLDFINAN